MTTLANKTILVTGGLQGLGKAITSRIIEDRDLNLILLAKDKNEATNQFLTQARTNYGIEARFISTDIRDVDSINAAVDKTASLYGGIDILIHAATVMITQHGHTIPQTQYDLSCDINARSSFLLAKSCFPYLSQSKHAHILNIAPPINLDPKILGSYTTYAASQYMRSMITVGLANHSDWIKNEISVNALWPLKQYKSGENVLMYQSHTQQQLDLKDISIMGDAAHAILSKPYGAYNGEFFYDEEVLELAGIDFAKDDNISTFENNPQYARDNQPEDIFA